MTVVPSYRYLSMDGAPMLIRREPHMADTLKLVLILVASAMLASAERNRSWDVLVQSVKTGKSVVVYRMAGGHSEGKLLAIDDNSITVQQKGQPQVIQRGDVFRVRYANIRRRNTLLGMAIGIGAGAAIVGAATDSAKAAGATAGALFGMGFGALGGGVLPLGAPLYEAERSEQRAQAAKPQR